MRCIVLGDSRPIGIFDSGVGGLTVVKSLISELPGESFLYLGDTANVPYGNKSREQLFHYATQIIDFFLAQDVKAIVVACGTHSSITLPSLQDECPVPIIGVLKPGVKAASKISKNKKIGVLATQATVNSLAYSLALNSLILDLQVSEVACPRFVPLVETALLDSDECRQAVKEYIEPLVEADVDTIILGCTHYPFLSPLINEYTKNKIFLVDPAYETICELKKILQENTMFNDDECGRRDFLVSGDAESFYNASRLLIGDLIQNAEKVVLDDDNNE